MPCQPEILLRLRHLRHSIGLITAALLLVVASANAFAQAGFFSPVREAVISVADQKMVVMEGSKKVATFPVSTSRYGSGDRRNSWSTPLGTLRIAQKIGDKMPSGSVFRRRQPTGEIIQPNAPGRDPIVSRILWLSGIEEGNKNAYERCIYIHGTSEERYIGRRASFGCIRMKSKDVIILYDLLSVGSRVTIVADNMKAAISNLMVAKLQSPEAGSGPIPAIK